MIAIKPQTSCIILLLFLVLLLSINWRIDRTRAEQMQQAIDACVYKGGFVIYTKTDVYGIVCGRAEEFHNKDIPYGYEVWPVWKIKP